MHVEANDKMRTVFLDQLSDVIRRYTDALNRIFPDLSAEETRLRLFLVVGVMAHVLAWGNRINWLPDAKDWQDRVNETLVQFATAGVRGSVQQGRTQ
jgi:hypothetical protein